MANYYKQLLQERYTSCALLAYCAVQQEVHAEHFVIRELVLGEPILVCLDVVTDFELFDGLGLTFVSRFNLRFRLGFWLRFGFGLFFTECSETASA